MICRTQVKSKKNYELNGSNGIVHNSNDIATIYIYIYIYSQVFSIYLQNFFLNSETRTFYLFFKSFN